MQKSAPSPARIGAMVVFALSCFGLLLFLWLSFGGPIPLKPQGYRFQVGFPEAPTLSLEADVRVAGVSVGKVRKKRLEDDRSRTLVTIELDRRFAPVRADARAMLRQKTLLGETYVELTPGTSSRTVPEGGRLADGRVEDAVQLDEIFQALDPKTRQAFRTWQQELAKGIEGRGRDLNDALGTLPGFAADAGDVLAVLDTQQNALSRLVKNTGVVFGALTENEAQLRNLITGAGRLFEATASQADALAEAISIFPTFLDESKATMARLKTFAADADPLMRDLEPVARDLGPTLRDVRGLAPDLERTFVSLDPLIDASRTGLPALRDTLRALRPMLAEMGPFLTQLNPMLQFFEENQMGFSDFISQGAAPLADTTKSPTGGIGHYLRQIGVEGAEAVAIWGNRLPSNRGNSYLPPLGLYPMPPATDFFMYPNWDCKPSGGPVKPQDPAPPSRPSGSPGCWVGKHPNYGGRLQGTFPHIEAADYSDRK
ncbi:MAG TPA: MlaD family protein [Solirubrobacteraceae bacterium]|nr:MlaD family protein [Solirubrobacteraceae bacterium]